MVEILLATHNSEKYIAQLMDSLLTQSLPDIRILISDDGSVDETKNIINSYAENNPNIFILENKFPLGGAKENFFYLMAHAKADYVLFADHDDVWYPDKAAKTMEAMRKLEQQFGTEKPLLVHSDLEVVDENLKTKTLSMMSAQKLSKTFKTLNRFLPQNHVTGCTVMVNKALIKRVAYTSLDPIIMHDWWMALIACAFGGVEFLDEPTIKYRQHPDNEIGAVDTRSPSYVSSRLSNTGTMKKRIKDTYWQAGEFYRTYGSELSEYDAQMVRAYSECLKINKWARIRVLFRFRLFKYGFVRKIGQLILG
jgi:glycosyltransferase involved in cell wall biosynthesis